MNLPSADDLFTTQEERDQKNQEYVKNISIYEITDFPNHPFKVKMDDKMLETIESVRAHGHAHDDHVPVPHAHAYECAHIPCHPAQYEYVYALLTCLSPPYGL